VLLERFRREARAAAQLHHTNIVPVFEVGQEGDTCFYAMQFIQGQPLDQVFQDLQRQRSRDYRHVARLGLQVAEGLGYAHARGILHRDVKPSNLLLDAQGVVWISDFGLARTQERALTQTADIVGTLRYMAPERFRGQCDARADLYALGLTLYELLTLRPAFSPDGRRILGVGGKPGELVLVTWDARE
jgi:serine/threonine protein kinase